MLEINFDVNSGFVAINNYPLELKDVETFKNSEFYTLFSPLNTIGSYYFSIDNIEWKDQTFILELRPSVFILAHPIFGCA